MARVRVKAQATVSSTSAEERDLGYPLFEVVTDSLNEGGSWTAIVPAATTDLPISLGTVSSAKFVQIITEAKNPNETPGTIGLKKTTTGGEVIDIVPLTDTKKGYWSVTTSGITNLYVTNAGTVIMKLTITVAGD